MSVDDLRQDELQLLEDGVPQTIDSFEHVVVAPGSPRSRVFVVFLDTYHTTIEDETSRACRWSGCSIACSIATTSWR